MMRTIKYLALFFNFILISSCEEKKDINQSLDVKSVKYDTILKPQLTKDTKLNTFENKKSNSNIYFVFYNSTNAEGVNNLFKDSLYTVILNYHSSFDTITNRLFDNEYPSRDLFFYKIKENLKYSLIDKSPTQLSQKYRLDTIVPANINEILFDVKFNSKGIFFINGYIEDYLYTQDSKELLDSSLLKIISRKLVIAQEVEIFEN